MKIQYIYKCIHCGQVNSGDTKKKRVCFKCRWKKNKESRQKTKTS